MAVIIAVISMFVIAGIAQAVNRFTANHKLSQKLKICPICAGALMTWLWMIVAKFFGYDIDLVIPAVLMGGSVVGIANLIEKRLPDDKSRLLWKLLFMPAGFIIVWSVLMQWWSIFLISLALVALIYLWFFGSRRDSDSQGGTTDDLKKKMEECC